MLIQLIRMILQKLYCLVTLGFVLSSGQFIFLNTGVFKFIVGLGLPIDVDMPGGSLTWFTNVQVFYKLPDNITQYEPYRVMEKRSVKNTFNRYNVYHAFAKYIERLGVYGSQCVHRLICEVARRKVNWTVDDLFGQLIHIIFSPGRDTQQGLEEHKKAQWQGWYNNSDCGIIYEDCFLQENSILLR